MKYMDHRLNNDILKNTQLNFQFLRILKLVDLVQVNYDCGWEGLELKT
jgi:hypothetical protein